MLNLDIQFDPDNEGPDYLCSAADCSKKGIKVRTVFHWDGNAACDNEAHIAEVIADEIECAKLYYARQYAAAIEAETERVKRSYGEREDW